MSRITIKDIAIKLNINASTVSRALRDHPDVSPQLRQTIKDLAAELGYSPNQLAINLRKGKTFTIALMIPEISMFFFPSVIRAVEELAHEKGYNLLVLHSNDNVDRETENAIICANMGVDGVLVSLSRESSDLDHFIELANRSVPIVYFDKVLPGSPTHQVVIPGGAATVLAITQLVDACKEPAAIIGIFGDPRMSITRDRLDGFREYLHYQNIDLAPDQILFADTAGEAELQLDHYLDKKLPSGIFLMSDEILSGAIKSINRRPELRAANTPIVAMSDGFLPALLPYPISFVETSGYEIGTAACSLLFNLILGLPVLPETHYIEVRFHQV